MISNIHEVKINDNTQTLREGSGRNTSKLLLYGVYSPLIENQTKLLPEAKTTDQYPSWE